jgi:hypothetical protein
MDNTKPKPVRWYVIACPREVINQPANCAWARSLIPDTAYDDLVMSDPLIGGGRPSVETRGPAILRVGGLDLDGERLDWATRTGARWLLGNAAVGDFGDLGDVPSGVVLACLDDMTMEEWAERASNRDWWDKHYAAAVDFLGAPKPDLDWSEIF